jgi:hypothetical protein
MQSSCYHRADSITHMFRQDDSLLHPASTHIVGWRPSKGSSSDSGERCPACPKRGLSYFKWLGGDEIRFNG